MSTAKQGCWLQCAQCGKIYFVEQKVPIDKLYVVSVCAGGCECERALNLGDDESQIYTYYDPVLDERFYKY